jgi:hypothetical protein
LPSTDYGFLEVEVADVDLDGLNDLLFANIEIIFTDASGNPIDSLIGRTACFHNEGDGFFEDDSEARIPQVSTETRKLALSDVDCDGDLDLLEIGFVVSDQPITLFVNDGTGHFAICEHPLPEFGTWINDVEFGCLDDDLYPDLFAANVEPGEYSLDHLLINGGSLAFTDASELLPDRLDFSVSCELFDHLNDGDIDIITANGGRMAGPDPEDARGQNALDQNLLNDPVEVLNDNVVAVEEFRLYPISPNPLRGPTTLRFALPRASRITFVIFDVSGREADRLIVGTRPAGDHTVTWRPEDVANGVYWCQLMTDGQVVGTRKTVVLR